MLTTGGNMFTPPTLTWLETILHERFGHHFSLAQHDKQLTMRLPEAGGAILFDTLIPDFHQTGSNAPCSHWAAASQGYTAALGLPLPAPGAPTLPAQLIEPIAQGHAVHYDILGLTYWMLARLEEVNPPASVLDNHGRFPATASHAFKHGYLERPIVDEWLHILGQVIKRTWPSIELKKHHFKVKVSHDVDSPSLYGFKSWRSIGRMMAGHLLKRHDLEAFFTAPFVKLATQERLHKLDPHNTFDWLMDVSESNNLQSAFYFMCGGHHPRDADYQLTHPAIRTLMRQIHDRGHEIGLHPSYETFKNPRLIRQEALRLKNICAEEKIQQSQWGGRMHYLRWEQPTTLRAWDFAGMNYDSTLGYADRPGFRCGTCFEYPAFDPVAQQQLLLRIRPLIVMECTVISELYMGLGPSDEAVDVIDRFKNTCQAVEGNFTILWHNSYLNNPQHQNIYKRIVAQ